MSVFMGSVQKAGGYLLYNENHAMVAWFKKGMVQPLAFETMTMFKLAGFKLKEIIIKEQHNCQATGYWKTNSIKYNFLLLAHEYLFVFKK